MPRSELIRVGVVEDSPIASELIRRVVANSSVARVTGSWPTVRQFEESPEASETEVVLLDLLLPNQSGLAALRDVAMRRAVVVVSDVSEDSALAREALAQGAKAFVPKRTLATDAGRNQLLGAITSALGNEVDGPPWVVVAVGSTGAVGPMEQLLTGIKGLGAGVVVLQHLPEQRDEAYARWIASLGWSSRVARAGDTPKVGTVLVAPSGAHLEFSDERRARLSRADPVKGHRPAATVLLASMGTFCPRLVVVVLSGMGQDGAASVAQLAERGASIFALDPTQCIAPSMPHAALQASPRVRRVALPALASTIRRAVERDA